jgi:hypothetical protein
MRAASININTNVVEGFIVADATIDTPSDGTYLVNVDNNIPVNFGWIYDPNTNLFVDPNQTVGQ